MTHENLPASNSPRVEIAGPGSHKPLTSRRGFLKRAAATLAAGAAATLAAPELARPVEAAAPAARPSGPGHAPYPAWADASFDDLTKDYDRLEGVFTIYRYRNDLLMEVTAAQISGGDAFLLEATRATGTADRSGGLYGDPLGDVVFSLTHQNDQILLVEPVSAFRADSRTPEATSVSRSFAPGFLASFPIAAVKLSDDDQTAAAKIVDKADKVKFMEAHAVSFLCPLKSFFLSDVTGFMTGMAGYHPDPDKSFIESVKVFPTNLVVSSYYAFAGSPLNGGTFADSRSFPETVIFNLFALPASDGPNAYTPRYYDDRIGYFTTDYLTFDDDVTDDNVRRLIQRWHLVKKDPSAAMSDPVAPITWWVDNATPLRYRAAIQEGILGWNKAFEKIGFKNAIVCNVMPDNADWDTADMRYNVVRWMTSPGFGYAVSLMRSNPLSGELVACSINIDASMTRFTNVDYPLDVTILSGLASDADEAAALNPDQRTPQAIARHLVRPRDLKPDAASAFDPLTKCRCDLGAGARLHAGFGWSHIELAPLIGGDAAPAISLEDYTHSYLRMVTSHEMGHCLGLRHNFRASTMLSMQQLQDPAIVAQDGVCASLMDYAPANIAPLGGRQAQYYQNGPGLYDYWAIEYGYSDWGHHLLPSMDLPNLRAIAARDAEFGHDFASDESAGMGDPTIAVFDLSADPLGYHIAMMQRGYRVMDAVNRRYPNVGDSYYELTRKFRGVALGTMRHALDAAGFIGGVVTYRNHRGDPNAKTPVQPINFADQRRALSAVCEHVFDADAFSVSPDLLARLQQNPNPYSDNPAFSTYAPLDFSYLDMLSNFQAVGVFVALDPSLLGRLETNEYRAAPTPGDQPLTVLETINAVTDAIWSELAPPAVAKSKPNTPDTAPNAAIRISPLRRRLQRTYVDAMEMLAQPNPYLPDGDSQAFALHALRSLVAQIDAAAKRPCDDLTQVHLEETRLRVARILNTQEVIAVPSPMI